jgi:hypothetical protein
MIPAQALSLATRRSLSTAGVVSLFFYFLNFFSMMPAGLITTGTGEALYGRCRLFTHTDLLKFIAYAGRTTKTSDMHT